MPRSQSRFALERAALVELVAEVSLATSLDARTVRVDLSPGQVRLSAAAPGVGESAAVLPVRFLGGGDGVIHTAFNPAYLLDALKSLAGETIVIDVAQNGCGNDHTVCGKPALLHAAHDPATRWVLMPVNAGLPPTRENLGSNFPQELAEADSA
jgi:DNA polymerase III sliding clamp (beta) subunit (PCNA family)